jgi:hypothetical protein
MKYSKKQRATKLHADDNKVLTYYILTLLQEKENQQSLWPFERCRFSSYYLQKLSPQQKIILGGELSVKLTANPHPMNKLRMPNILHPWASCAFMV